MSLHAGVNVTLCRYQCHFMHASVSLHTGVNVTVCRCQCHVMPVSVSFYARVNVTLFRCQCHFMTVSMSLYARVNVTLCRCRCHSVQVWNSNMMRDELMGVVRIDARTETTNEILELGLTEKNDPGTKRPGTVFVRLLVSSNLQAL